MSMGDLRCFRLVSMLFCNLVAIADPVCRGLVFSMELSLGIESCPRLSPQRLLLPVSDLVGVLEWFPLP